ncbi:Flp family type IVb pilin [Allobranchiibius huperziae]|uniref:Pilus assembly protein Flp/PilA n=1 Tax=Allobranchiibius huperziae TaxID=1874116 RepID=A0A853DAK6_9MICO|nr:Flp family type IVb pilin [Allobranchiibius huperziae]NYJ74292.1 pilus assembly protein Flp/PilA [Allobranchiibius huperziae]
MNAAAAYFFTTLVGLQDRLQTRKERGATAVEYGLLVGLIAVAIIASIGLLSTQIQNMFSSAATSLTGK